MYQIIKKPWLYFLIIFACLAGYFVYKSILERKIIVKEFAYSTASATEVYMVWGLQNGKILPKNLWPANSYLKDDLVFTKMANTNNRFVTTLKLPPGSNLYYWMVQRKDKFGNETDVWDTGGSNEPYFKASFPYGGIVKPGFFIFLAGVLPLLLNYFKNRKEKSIQIDDRFKIKNYISQFDSIRAIAVLLVIVHHWLSENHILNFLPNGALGVNIFFVLSGFLITGILLKSKQQVEQQGLKKVTLFKNFYVRRTLRIFPNYYLLLLVFWIINDPAIQKDGIYYFTYTSNFLFYNEQFFPARLSHLWSLAVEEQFYIFWPWLIILVNRKLLPYLIALFIVIGVSSNYIFIEKDWWVTLFTPACFDAFAIGAFLSYLVIYRQDVIEQIQPKFIIIFFVVILLFILDVFEMSVLPRRTIHALLAAVLIYYCLFKNSNKKANYVLNSSWLIRLGKISYGVYLYHLFIPELWLWVNTKFNAWNIDFFYNQAMPETIKPTWLFIQHFAFLILICIVSWKFIEKPINSLKKHFENKSSLGKHSSRDEAADLKTFSF
jgi:peptidoglycan/LPS O-acetylase OafA/YrhL